MINNLTTKQLVIYNQARELARQYNKTETETPSGYNNNDFVAKQDKAVVAQLNYIISQGLISFERIDDKLTEIEEEVKNIKTTFRTDLASVGRNLDKLNEKTSRIIQIAEIQPGEKTELQYLKEKLDEVQEQIKLIPKDTVIPENNREILNEIKKVKTDTVILVKEAYNKNQLDRQTNNLLIDQINSINNSISKNTDKLIRLIGAKVSGVSKEIIKSASEIDNKFIIYDPPNSYVNL